MVSCILWIAVVPGWQQWKLRDYLVSSVAVGGSSYGAEASSSQGASHNILKVTK